MKATDIDQRVTATVNSMIVSGRATRTYRTSSQRLPSRNSASAHWRTHGPNGAAEVGVERR